MNILVILTGGTIGSTIQDGYISTKSDNSKYILINNYYEMYGKDVSFETTSPYTILSENINGSHLNLLHDCIKTNIDTKNYDGIIITHGTDTLQYTSAAMEYLFNDAPIPIVFVSSNYVLSDPKANGLTNFRTAVTFIKTTSYKGVFVSYRNSKGVPLIHKGSRILSHPQYSDDINSINNQYFGKITENTFYKNEAFTSSGKIASTYFNNNIFTENSPVIYIKAYPGQTYPDIPIGTEAILIESYHSGTLCTSSYELLYFSKKAKSLNIPIFLSGVEDRVAYESTKEFENLNIIPVQKSSSIAIYMKLWLILSNNLPIELIHQPFADEFE